MEEFKKQYCQNCKNKDTDLCNITITVDNKLKCSEYEENKC